MKNTGIYIHIPFCKRKCPYCDFFSKKGSPALYDEYTDRMCEKIVTSPYRGKIIADTLYFGGGTPGLIGAERIARLIGAVRQSFCIDTDNAEVTVELNPGGEEMDFALLKSAGVNRISFGLQSAVDDELKVLGRRHSRDDVIRCTDYARKAGFENISLDLMIAVPGQTLESLHESVRFCIDQGAEHISAYILKIEEGTLFYRRKDSLSLPDDDETAGMYEYLCKLMKENGYQHYEISNFCKSGHEGRHNLKYWHDEEYLGFGPAAHSFIDGRRFYCPRSFDSFYRDEIIDDGEGGSEEEYIMLGLRLAEGIVSSRFRERFGYDIPQHYLRKCKALSQAGLVHILPDGGFALTEKGFLVSNAVIANLTE